MLQIIRLKPNPAGKDRPRHSSLSASQLAGEWVDLQNRGSQTIILGDAELNHNAYPASGGAPSWQGIRTFIIRLAPGEILRIHSGADRDLSFIRLEDLQEAHYHAFTGSDQYVWNNAEGDCAGLWSVSRREWLDSACYDRFPPEGVVLSRSGERLVPVRVGVL